MTELHTAYPTAAAQQKSNTTLIIVAVSMGILTVLLTTLYTSRVKAAIATKMVTVYKLNKAKAVGEVFKASRDVRQEQMLQESVDALGNVLSEQGVRNWDGKPFMQAAREGDLLTTRLFSESGGLDDIPVDDGFVACPLVINARTTTGLIRPGRYISILGTFVPPGQLPTTKMVMEKVKVVAVGTQTDPAAGSRASFGNITVQVLEKEALALVAIGKVVGKDGFDVLILPNNHPQKMIGINEEVLKMPGVNLK